MNILFFYFSAIAPERGGVERVTSVLANYFESQGHCCFYLATSKENVDVSNSLRQLFLPNLEKIQSPENLDFYKNLLREKRIDVVVFQGAHRKFPWRKFNGHPSLICALHLDPFAYETIVKDKFAFKFQSLSGVVGASLALLWRGVAIPAKIILRRLKISAVYRWNYVQCDRYVVLSDTYVKGLVSHLGGKSPFSKIICIPNPCSYFPSSQDFEKEKFLLYISRLQLNQKRPDLMLEIWSKLADEFPDWHLELLGDGIDADKVKKIVWDQKVPRVNFRGFTNPIPYFKKAPFLCMTSSNEGFGMVLLEASAFGCVPIAFNSFPAVLEIICDNVSGCLVPALDIEAYADKLRKLMRGEMVISSEACKTNAQRYSIDRVGGMWISLFEKIT